MATIGFDISELQTYGDHGHVISWGTLGNGDDGTPLRMVGSADRSVQVVGTFGTGGTVKIEGSNDGTNYAVLHDPGLNEISVTAAGIHAVLEISAYIRPRVSAGDVNTALDVTLLVRRP